MRVRASYSKENPLASFKGLDDALKKRYNTSGTSFKWRNHVLSKMRVPAIRPQAWIRLKPDIPIYRTSRRPSGKTGERSLQLHAMRRDVCADDPAIHAPARQTLNQPPPTSFGGFFFIQVKDNYS